MKIDRDASGRLKIVDPSETEAPPENVKTGRVAGGHAAAPTTEPRATLRPLPKCLETAEE